DEEDPRRDPVRPVRARMGPREPGPSRGILGHAPARRRSSDRGGRQAAALDDVLDQAAEGVMASRIPVAREGWPFILGPAVAALGFTLLGRRRLAAPFWAA